MKKQVILLTLLAIFLMFSGLYATKISFEEFSQETGLTIEDFDHDSPSINYIDVTVFDDYYLVCIDGKSYIVYK